MAEFGDEEFALRFVAFALADVARDLGCADDPPCVILHRRDRERDSRTGCRPCAGEGLVMLDALAALDALRGSRLLVLTIGRNQDGDGLPMPRSRCSRTVVPRRRSSYDDAVEILADDGVSDDSTIAASRRACLPPCGAPARRPPARSQSRVGVRRHREARSRSDKMGAGSYAMNLPITPPCATSGMNARRGCLPTHGLLEGRGLVGLLDVGDADRLWVVSPIRQGECPSTAPR